MTQYYYMNGQTRLGPFTLEALYNENVCADTQVWKEGMSDWVKLKDMPDLEPVLKKIPPPPPLYSESTGQPPIPPMPSLTMPADGQQLAGADKRFLAYLIDVLLISVVGLVPVLGWIAGIIYYFLRDALPFLNGQSLGKKAMKIRVVCENNGTQITNDYGKSAIRNLSLMIPIFGLIDAFMVFSDDKKRFGDKWANTKVVLVA